MNTVPKTPFIDRQTGDISKEWRYFLIGIWSAQGGSVSTPTWDIMPTTQPVESFIQQDDVTPTAVTNGSVYEDVTPPQYQQMQGDDVTPYGRIEALESAVQLLQQQIDSLKQGTTA